MPGHGCEMASELVYRADFLCNRYCKTSTVDLEGAKSGRKANESRPLGTSRTPDSSLKSP
jgi:hypothetical protein